MSNARPVIDRFIEKIAPVSSWEACWNWAGYRDERGYGTLGHRGKMKKAHRVSFELAYGFIPSGLVIDHLCRNHSCVNPTHLEAVTQGENARRGEVGQYNARKTHCVSGHPYSPENTYHYRNERACRTCRRDRDRRRREAKRAQG
jgi:hypothetical protein